MSVRPFYLSAYVDGRKTAIGSGPKNGEGGMSMTITQRDEGSIVTAFRVDCYRKGDELHTIVYNDNGYKIFEKVTKY